MQEILQDTKEYLTESLTSSWHYFLTNCKKLNIENFSKDVFNTLGNLVKDERFFTNGKEVWDRMINAISSSNEEI